MTRAEFDGWLEQHHGELLAVAKRRTEEGAEDVVQEAVATFLTHRDLPAIDHPWTYLVNAVRSVAGNRRRSVARAKAAARDLRVLTRAEHSHGRRRPAPRAE